MKSWLGPSTLPCDQYLISTDSLSLLPGSQLVSWTFGYCPTSQSPSWTTADLLGSHPYTYFLSVAWDSPHTLADLGYCSPSTASFEPPEWQEIWLFWVLWTWQRWVYGPKAQARSHGQWGAAASSVILWPLYSPCSGHVFQSIFC